MSEFNLQSFWDEIINDDISSPRYTEPSLFLQEPKVDVNELRWEFCNIYMQNEIFYCEMVKSMKNRFEKCQNDLFGCQQEIDLIKLNFLSLQKERTFWKDQCFFFQKEKESWEKKYTELEKKNLKRKNLKEM